MTLRLAWVGPWNTNSAIATFGHYVIEELAARGHAVTIFRCETGGGAGLPPLPTSCPVMAMPAPACFPRDFDGVIVNIGDNHDFHGAAIPLLQALPCLGILHDGFLSYLAAGWAEAAAAETEATLRACVATTYGPGTWRANESYWMPLDAMARTRPMTEWMAQFCAGVVTHSESWAPRMRLACPGAVTVLPLAFPGEATPRQPIRDRLIVATIGHANANKCPDAVLQAIASDDVLRQRCEYRLLGPITPAERDRLAGIAQGLGLAPPLCTGWLEDAALRAAVAEVHVIACLRNPILEAGSASLITALLAGRPTLVSRHGVYAEVPEEVVLGCAPGREAVDVARHLRALLDDPSVALSLGERARSYAETTFSAASYVNGLLPAVTAAVSAAPAIQAARSFGRLLGSLGIGSDNPAVGRIGAMVEDTLGIRRAGGSADAQP
jgi:hypothetical protein